MATGDGKVPSAKSSSGEVEAFLRKVRATPPRPNDGRRGRLLFAIDATASREPTWDMACQLQAQMFAETAALGGLEVQLCFYRGFGELRKSPWHTSPGELIAKMQRVRCLAGRTQIARVLRHTLRETKRQKVNALVFVGDVVEEDIDALGHLAGELGLVGTPAFVFQEGAEPVSRRAFEQIARLSGGAYAPFDTGSAAQLRALLMAVAVFSAGGRAALESYGRQAGALVQGLARQLPAPGRR